MPFLAFRIIFVAELRVPILLQVLLGLLKPHSGRVSVQCGGVTAVPGPGLGWMPQALSLHNYFSVSEILRYYATLGGVPPHLRRRRISTVLEFLNLSDKVRGCG